MTKETIDHSSPSETMARKRSNARKNYFRATVTNSRARSPHHHPHFTSYSHHFHSKFYHLSNFWIRIFNFSFSFNIVNVFNFGSSVSIKLHRPHTELIPSILLKLPMFCKFSVVTLCTLLFDNLRKLGRLICSCNCTSSKLKSNRRTYSAPRASATALSRGRQEGMELQRANQLPILDNQLLHYFGSLQLNPVTVVGMGLSLFGYQQYQRQIQSSGVADANGSAAKSGLVKEWTVNCYRMFPLKAVSRWWGWFTSVQLPTWARHPLYTLYAYKFNCNVREAEVEDLREYRSLGEFFRRKLKPGLRPICLRSEVISPVDGTILNCGKVQSGVVEQVKGVTYSLSAFLGPQTWKNINNNDYDENSSNHSVVDIDNEEYCKGLLKNADNALYHCIIYLAPGDYHRFHSPTKWAVNFRRHFAGELLSVNPMIAKWIAGLFSLNERAVYAGEWEHGFFSYTAVGATNVGSIKVYKDKELITNCRGLKKGSFQDKKFEKANHYQKGNDFGEFNLGSTVVLIFEAPHNFQFSIEPNTKIYLGQSLFKYPQQEVDSPEDSITSEVDFDESPEVFTV